jgi:prolyl-tRNA synthetase
MLQSQLFPKTLREAPKDEVSANAIFLTRGGFIDKLMAGAYSYLPLGLRVLKKIENIIRKEMEVAGGQEILMPALQPKENWEKTGRWDSLDVLFRFTSHYTKTEYALGSTHEEIVVPLAQKFSLSYKNLPLYLFQIQTKFRDEKRAKSGILRGREFSMKDLYSFHTSQEDLDLYYEKMKGHYMNVFKAIGLGDITYETFASGGSFSKYSHEFQTEALSGEDTIYVCDTCKIAINKEIIEEQNSCPKCGNKNLRETKAIEVGNIFPLKTKYSEPFGLKFTAEDGSQKDVIMGCYGMGPSRVMGTIVEVCNDERGIVWPETVAPFKVHLISLGNTITQAKELYEKLQKEKVEVLFDDRTEISAGEKFADADLIGIPYRVVISEKTLKENKVELKKRSEKEAKLISEEELLNYVR